MGGSERSVAHARIRGRRPGRTKPRSAVGPQRNCCIRKRFCIGLGQNCEHSQSRRYLPAKKRTGETWIHGGFSVSLIVRGGRPIDCRLTAPHMMLAE